MLEALSGTGSRQAIAGALYVSVNTVKTQLASVYRRLGCTNRADASGWRPNTACCPDPSR